MPVQTPGQAMRDVAKAKESIPRPNSEISVPSTCSGRFIQTERSLARAHRHFVVTQSLERGMWD